MSAVGDPSREAGSKLADAGPLETRLLVDGELVEARSGGTLEVLAPRDGSRLAHVAAAGAGDVDDAVAVAKRAAPGWAATPAARRGELLARLADLVAARAPELAALETLDAGHPARDATELDLPRTLEVLRYFAGAADKLEGGSSAHRPGVLNYVIDEPIGVVGQIVPWNQPLMFAAWKLAPALAAGNAVVLKPAELAPLSTIRLAGLIAEAGFPPGVVNVLAGRGEEAGARLAEHPEVRKIVFTGSTEVGRSIVRASAGNLKRVGLELGGKGPNIVFADADLDRALAAALSAGFHNQGQACIAGARLLVQRKIAAELLERLGAAVEELAVGDPLDPRTEIGPVISAGHRERILGDLERAAADGAETVAEAPLPADPALAGGYFVAPRVLRAEPEAAISREEVFGPVVTFTVFDDDAEAVAIANSLEYGLGAGLWTSDVERAHRVGAALEAGVVWINTYKYAPPGSPFGGIKQSGYGREMGLEGMREYCNTKSVWVDYTGSYPARFGNRTDEGG